MGMESGPQPEKADFQCNICGEHCLVGKDQLQREVASCKTCGSSPRARAIIRVLSLGLFGKNLSLPDFPVSRGLSGLGMSDWDGYAVRLAEKFRYTNTYYHKEPRLDISNPVVPESLAQSNDFIISSEVFEHVAPPVRRAFENTFKMLKPGGILVLTVPYGTRRETIEHFPDLFDFTITADDGTHRLKNVTQSGEVQEFHDLVFHGGPGATLEMRVFAEGALLKGLSEAGFEAITVHRTPDPAHGISWPEPWSFPFSARRPR
jgi:SAM-dependent methyltransferase